MVRHGALLGLRGAQGAARGKQALQAALGNGAKPKSTTGGRPSGARESGLGIRADDDDDSLRSAGGPTGAGKENTQVNKRARDDVDVDLDLAETPVVFSRRRRRAVDVGASAEQPNAWLDFSAVKTTPSYAREEGASAGGSTRRAPSPFSKASHPRRLTPFGTSKNPFAVATASRHLPILTSRTENPERSSRSGRNERIERNEQSEIQDADDRTHCSGPPGFSNLGNTCYLNSVVQCLLGEKAFVDEIIRLEAAGAGSAIGMTPVTSAIHNVIKHRATGIERTLRLDGLKTALASSKFGGIFVGYQQQDAHEAYIKILECIEQEHGTAYRCPFAHGLLVEVVCEACGHVSRVEEKGHLNVLIDVRKTSSSSTGNSTPTTVERALQKTTEVFARDCEKCKGKEVEHTRTSLITDLPSVLVVQLRRFEFREGIMRKVDDAFVAQKMVMVSGDGSKRLELRGMVRHHGIGLAHGHYDARVLDASGRWWGCDDALVQPVDEGDVTGVAGSRSSYLLFYDLV